MGQPIEGMRFERTFTEPEVMVPFKCDVHGWMNAWVGVLDHPYFAVTGSDGAFDMSDLPPGDYVIEAWHEMLGNANPERDDWRGRNGRTELHVRRGLSVRVSMNEGALWGALVHGLSVRVSGRWDYRNS